MSGGEPSSPLRRPWPSPASRPASACLSARACHTVQRLLVRQDCVMLVRRGLKRWHGGAQVLEAQAGMLLAAPRGVVADVTNQPDARGRYEALAMIFPHELVAEAADPSGVARVPARAELLTPSAELREAFERAHRSLADAQLSARLKWLRAAEVIELLRLAGVVFDAVPPEVRERVARLIGSDPGHAWSAGEVAQALAMGDSTLRRHLAQAGTSVTDLLREVRLECGLGLLQGSTMSVTAIALAVGFQSPSRFSEAFRARFGFLPSLLRGR